MLCGFILQVYCYIHLPVYRLGVDCLGYDGEEKSKTEFVEAMACFFPQVVLNYAEFTNYSTWTIFKVRCASGGSRLFLSLKPGSQGNELRWTDILCLGQWPTGASYGKQL